MSDAAPIAFYVETNLGGTPVTLCTCGVLVYQPMFHVHAAQCPDYQEAERDGG